MPMPTRLPLLLLPWLALACSSAPPPGASGSEIYRQQGCASCHGDKRQGTSDGPTLMGLRAHWDPERLARYLEDPGAIRREDSRLRALDEQYPGEKDAYDHLSIGQRRTLAWWLISNGG